MAMALVCGAPARADAQPEQDQERDQWRISTVPLYFWAPVLDGKMSAGVVKVGGPTALAPIAVQTGPGFEPH